MQKSAPLRSRSATWGVWVLLGAILVAAFLIRWRLRVCPLERDEGEYAYIGRLLLEGVAPYGVAGNHKFPGTYLAYAAIMALFGETTTAIHIGLLIVNLITAALLFFLGRRLAGNVAGLAATAAWVVTSVSPGVFGNAAHLTHFVMLAVVAGSLLLWRGLETEKSWPLIIGGICLGASVVVRQTSLIFVVFGVVFFWLAVRRTREGATASAVLVAASSAIPLAATVLWLWIAGVLPEFWRWTITEAAAYGSQVSLQEGLHQFLASQGLLGQAEVLLWPAELQVHWTVSPGWIVSESGVKTKPPSPTVTVKVVAFANDEPRVKNRLRPRIAMSVWSGEVFICSSSVVRNISPVCTTAIFQP
jgi:hypothetical protein